MHPNSVSKVIDDAHRRITSPPIMSDGRFITDYSSANELTDRLVRSNGLRTSAQIREFMEKNGGRLLSEDRQRLLEANRTVQSIGCSESWETWVKRLGQDAEEARCRRAFIKRSSSE
jgi:hypothetical protein